MSYDIYLLDPVSGEVLEVDNPHFMRGGTYAVGGSNKLKFNVTFNYAPHFQSLGEGGIRAIHGLSGDRAERLLKPAIESLGDDVDSDYWNPTEGNAKRALYSILTMARMRPDGVFSVED